MTWLSNDIEGRRHLLNLESVRAIQTLMRGNSGGDILYLVGGRSGCIHNSDNRDELLFVFQNIKRAIADNVRFVSLSDLLRDFEQHTKCQSCALWKNCGEHLQWGGCIHWKEKTGEQQK